MKTRVTPTDAQKILQRRGSLRKRLSSWRSDEGQIMVASRIDVRRKVESITGKKQAEGTSRKASRAYQENMATRGWGGSPN